MTRMTDPPAPRPRLAVVGCEGALNRLVEARCGDVADLVFVGGRRAKKGFPPGIDCVVFSRFNRHSAFEKARGVPRLFCRGGLTSIVNAVRTYAPRLRAPRPQP
jgi:hypothetical protein